jgi:hypothetical protein
MTFDAKKMDEELGFIPRQVDSPALPEPKYSENKRIIDDKRAELELKKLEIEIEKLSSPNTSVDYFKQMLELQANHNKSLLEMQKQQFDIKLELEKMKLLSEGGGDDDLMGQLIQPLIPQLLNSKLMKGGEVTPEKPKMDLNEYAKAIQEGKITEVMAYEDFKLERPDLAKLTPYEVFKRNFDYMKANGKPPEKVLT